MALRHARRSRSASAPSQSRWPVSGQQRVGAAVAGLAPRVPLSSLASVLPLVRALTFDEIWRIVTHGKAMPFQEPSAARWRYFVVPGQDGPLAVIAAHPGSLLDGDLALREIFPWKADLVVGVGTEYQVLGLHFRDRNADGEVRGRRIELDLVTFRQRTGQHAAFGAVINGLVPLRKGKLHSVIRARIRPEALKPAKLEGGVRRLGRQAGRMRDPACLIVRGTLGGVVRARHRRGDAG